MQSVMHVKYTIFYSKFLQSWRINDTEGNIISGFDSPYSAIETIKFFCKKATIIVLGYGDTPDRTIELV